MQLWLCPSAFSPHRGGVEELTLKLARHLQQRGHRILVVTNRHPAYLAAAEQVDDVAVRRIAYSLPARRPASWARHLRAKPSLRKQVDNLPWPDVVHVICLSSQTSPMAAFAQRSGTPLVLTTQGETVMDAEGIYRKNPWLRRDLRRAASRAQVLTSCSDWTRRQIAGLAAPFQHAEVIPNGVDVDDWLMDPPGTSPVFAAWGRHVREKGFDLLMEAFVRVREEVPTASLLLGGDGPERDRLCPSPGVELLGPLDRAGVRAMLRRARVAVVPSRIEPFGIVALEALAAGRGLVYSSNGGLAEAAGVCGRSADPEDPAALAAAMLAELKAPTAAAAGRARATELSWSKIAVRYEEIYSKALQSHAAP